MNTLLILYLVYLSWGTAGQGRVSFLEMSRYLRCSKTHMRKVAFELADSGFIEVIETRSVAGSRKLYLQLSEAGDDFLMKSFDSAQAAYQEHVARTIEAIKARYQESEYAPKTLTKKQREAIAAGQKEMFE